MRELISAITSQPLETSAAMMAPKPIEEPLVGRKHRKIRQSRKEFDDGENKKVTLSYAAVIELRVSRKKRCPPSLPKTVNSYSTIRGFTFIGTRGDDFVQAMVSFVESIIQQPSPEGQVTQKLSSRGKYVSIKIRPIQVVSSE